MSALSALTSQELQPQLVEASVDASSLESVDLALTRMKLQKSAENRKLLAVLRSYKNRVTLKDMETAQGKIHVEVEEDFLLKRVLVCKKMLYPNLDKELELRWFIDAHRLEKFPAGLGREEVWVLDSGVMQPGAANIVLGPGWLENVFY